MEQDKRDSPPLWLQLPTPASLLRQQRRPPPIPASLLIFIPLVSLLFIFFLISYFVSNTSQIFRINFVKNGWDLLNVVLVVFAILCGLAGKLSEDQTSAVNTEVAIQAGTVSNKETARFSIFDEFNVSVSDAPASESVYRREGRREVEDESDIKVIPVDTCVIRRHLSPPAVASKPKLRRRRTPKSVLQPEKELTGDEYGMRQSPPSTTERRPQNNNNRKKRDATSECVTAIASTYHTDTTTQPLAPSSPPPQSQPPLPPPPPPSVFRNMFRKSTKPKRIHSEASAPPPPPPLPPTKAAAPPPHSIFRFKNKQFKSSSSRPPQSIFNNILKSRIKSKRFDSSTASPPPPPPPPPTSIFSNKFKSQLKSKLSRTSIAPPHPPLPLTYSIVDNISTTIPPPPPPYPPPSIFNNLLKFGTKSKRIDSSSAPRPPPQTESIHRRSSKPPLPKKVKNQYVDATDTQSSEIGVSNLDLWSTVGPQEVKEGKNPVGSVLCPSPDVNMKADKFIARLRSEWNLDKMNSFIESPSL